MEYKVIALSVSGTKKRIFKLGDIVTDNDFPNNNAEELVKKGFLKAIGEPEPKPNPPVIKDQPKLKPASVKKQTPPKVATKSKRRQS